MAHAQDGDLAQIEQTIGLYFQSHATGDAQYARQAFHADAKLFWVRDGAIHQRPVGEWLSGFNGTPSDDEAQRERHIVDINQSGDAAVVKVELDYPGALIHDYMSMLKLDGRWVIVNKTFVVHAAD
ncbi:MAG: nuclear transport factor 2 family protein [Rhodothermales bacterium]